jgi:hypothetical protein
MKVQNPERGRKQDLNAEGPQANLISVAYALQ